MQQIRSPRGFSLLEVLIALVVFSLGLLGLAGMMVLSVKANHTAYLRTQATFLAQSMADRMRTNVGWVEDYQGNYGVGVTVTNPCAAAACTPENLVKRDQAVWNQQLLDALPAPTANIGCQGSTPGSAIHRGTAPFDGLCTFTITWTEASLDRAADGAPATQTFAWVFQP